MSLFWHAPAAIVALAFIIGWKRPAFAWLPTPFALIAVMGLLLEIHDPQIAPALIHEEGKRYFAIAYLASVLAVLAPVGIWLVMRRRR